MYEGHRSWEYEKGVEGVAVCSASAAAIAAVASVSSSSCLLFLIIFPLSTLLGRIDPSYPFPINPAAGAENLFMDSLCGVIIPPAPRGRYPLLLLFCGNDGLLLLFPFT